MAKVGKGDCTFIDDKSIANLDQMVLNLLHKSCEPALTDCTLQFMKNPKEDQSNSDVGNP